MKSRRNFDNVRETLLFDRSRLVLDTLSCRKHLLNISDILPIRPVKKIDINLKTVANRIKTANKKGASVILMIGAHVLRSGVQRYLIDLMEKGFITCVAVNGAVVIHDFEFALVGATTENVAEYIIDGRFGFWQETGRINDIVKKAADDGVGLGKAVGQVIEEEKFPYREISILAAAYRCGCPVTVHVAIGYDIVHQHPNFDGSSWGQTSYTDFLKFAKVLENLENGVVMNFGSAVMAPEVYLKALSMVRNIARQENRAISMFTTLVCDLVKLPKDYSKEAARDTADYFFRPWKTMLIRTIRDGGEGFYVRGKHAETMPQLWTAIVS